MFCSVIIPTIGRSTLSRAVHSVLEQPLLPSEFEIIVVNDSGQPLAEEDWQHLKGVQLVTTYRRERSCARNTGAAIAKGRYLCFLDDDDWLLPGAFREFWTLAGHASDAAWLYGGIRIVEEMTGRTLAEINSGLSGNCFVQIMGGAWAPIQASLIRNDAFFSVGGYNPSIIGTEDLDLCRRIALQGDFANTPVTVACLARGRSWTTSTDYDRAPEDTLRSRDEVLAEPGAFSRMLASADSNYWYGRLFRVYVSTARWNLQHRRRFAALSRGVGAIAGLVLAGPHLFSADFWRAARAHHVPDTLHFVMEAFEQEVEQVGVEAPRQRSI